MNGDVPEEPADVSLKMFNSVSNSLVSGLNEQMYFTRVSLGRIILLLQHRMEARFYLTLIILQAGRNFSHVSQILLCTLNFIFV